MKAYEIVACLLDEADYVAGANDMFREMGLDPFAMTDDDWDTFYNSTMRELGKNMPDNSSSRHVKLRDEEVEQHLQGLKKSLVIGLAREGMTSVQRDEFIRSNWPKIEAEVRMNPVRSEPLSSAEIDAKQNARNAWRESKEGRRYAALALTKVMRGMKRKDFGSSDKPETEEQFQTRWAQNLGFGKKPTADDALSAYSASKSAASPEVQKILRNRADDISNQI